MQGRQKKIRQTKVAFQLFFITLIDRFTILFSGALYSHLSRDYLNKTPRERPLTSGALQVISLIKYKHDLWAIFNAFLVIASASNKW